MTYLLHHRSFSWRKAMVATIILAVGSLGLGPVVASASPTTVSFSYTGSPQSWTVPAGVASITVDMAGAAGLGGNDGAAGGSGGRVQGNVSVAAGTTLTIEVGGMTGFPDGGPGGLGSISGGGSGDSGGAGGGASVIRSASGDLAVAGGGGGGGGGGYTNTTSTAPTYGSAGGAGGGLSGIAGGGYGGGGGSQSSGGSAGYAVINSGTSGVLSSGGAGAGGATWSNGYQQWFVGAGGGGGGGYYGGGGGGAPTGSSSGEAGGGGGGGSSLVPAGGTTTSGYEAGNGYVTISYTPTTPSFTSAAAVSFTSGASSSFTVTTGGASPISLSASGALPAGLSFVAESNGTATISGTPTGPVGNYTLDLTASNSYGSASQQLVVSVTSATASSSGSAVTTGTGNATGTLDAGTLSFASTPANLTFPAISLDGSNQSTSAALPIDIADATGSGAGWNVTVTSTQFSDGSATLPASATSVNTAPSSTCDVDSSCTPAALSSSVTYPLTIPAGSTAPAATRLYSAAAGSGMGNQTFSPTITLAVPANAAAGAYSSDWTLSLVSGP